jgi:hypothetical protein
VALSEEPSRRGRAHFLELTGASDIFPRSRLRLEAALTFERERTGLPVALENIDRWITETNCAPGLPAAEPAGAMPAGAGEAGAR